MKISDISNNMDQIGKLDTSGSRQKEENNINQTAETEVKTGTKVDISSASVEFSKAAEQMDTVPEDRANNIERLKMMVHNGSYNVDSKKIAEKIVKDSIENIM